MLTKSVKSVISVVLKHVAQAKKSVQSVQSVSFNIRMVSLDSNNLVYEHCIFPDARRVAPISGSVWSLSLFASFCFTEQ